MLNTYTEHEFYMKIALQEAQKAYDEGEVPVGAVIVCNGQIIAKAHNQTELLTDVTAHAEIIAISIAQEYLQTKILDKCTLYVTLEPCLMCAGALYWSRIKQVVFGAYDQKRGYSQFTNNALHSKTSIISGILEKQQIELLQNFFKEKRKK